MIHKSQVEEIIGILWLILGVLVLPYSKLLGWIIIGKGIITMIESIVIAIIAVRKGEVSL